MSLSGALSSALSGLTATTRSAEVISDNVANALTDGFAARETRLSARGLGGGVSVDAIVRRSDPPATTERRLSDASAARADGLSDAQTRLAELYGGPSDPGALPARAVAFETALERLADSPASETLQRGAVDAARDLAQSLSAAADGVQELRRQADSDIARMVDTLNASLASIEDHNRDIRLAASNGLPSAPLEEARDRAIDRVAELIPVRVVDRGQGEVALYAPGGAILLDGRAVEVGFTQANTVVADTTLASGALSGLTLNGVEVSVGTGGGRLDGGRLGAAFELRDALGPQADAQLDAMAADLIQRFEAPGPDPTLVPGDPGLFTDNGAAYDPLLQVGLATRLEINAAVDPDAGGAYWRIRDGVGAAAPGDSGEDALIRDLLAAFADPLAADPATGLQGRYGFADLAAGAASLRLTEASAAEDEAAFQSGRNLGHIETEALRLGVETDDELATLLLVEQAYAANARVIQAVDSLLAQLLEI
ncbi:MAG: flagellar basal body rod C-terminal domain-containing protein [Pseudomonadota bacterium]